MALIKVAPATAAKHTDEDAWNLDDEWATRGPQEFRHDPECMWYVACPDEECGVYLERFEDHFLADVATLRFLGGGASSPALGRLDRTPLEQVAPLLFDFCRRLRAGLLTAGHEANLDRLIAHAAGTPHLDVIIADTRNWWDAGSEQAVPTTG